MLRRNAFERKNKDRLKKALKKRLKLKDNLPKNLEVIMRYRDFCLIKLD